LTADFGFNSWQQIPTSGIFSKLSLVVILINEQMLIYMHGY